MRPYGFDDIHWGAALESRAGAVRFSNSKARITAYFLRERKRERYHQKRFLVFTGNLAVGQANIRMCFQRERDKTLSGGRKTPSVLLSARVAITQGHSPKAMPWQCFGTLKTQENACPLCQTYD